MAFVLVETWRARFATVMRRRLFVRVAHRMSGFFVTEERSHDEFDLQHPRDPFSLTEPVPDFTAATCRSIRGMRIAYSPNFDVFPVDRRVAEVVGRAVRAFEEAGARVER